MKKKIVVFGTLILLIAIYILYSMFWSQNDSSTNDISFLPDNPSSATFLHRGEEVSFENGTGVFGETEVRVRGEPLYGDLDGDMVEDAILVLEEEGGGDRQTYLALAIREDDGFLGMNSVALEGNVSSEDIKIRDEVVEVVIPETAEAVREYYTLVGNRLEKRDVEGTVHRGRYRSEHDEIQFVACDSDRMYKVSEESPALVVLEALYAQKRLLEEGIEQGMYAVVVAEEESESTETELSSEQTAAALRILTVLRVPEEGLCEEPALQQIQE